MCGEAGVKGTRDTACDMPSPRMGRNPTYLVGVSPEGLYTVCGGEVDCQVALQLPHKSCMHNRNVLMLRNLGPIDS